MPFRFEDQKIPGVTLIKPEEFRDERGSLAVTYQRDVFTEAGIETEFIQDKVSFSKKSVLRGLHYQKEGYSQAKIVRCTRGVVFDVVVDLRKGSPTYGQYAESLLSEHNNHMIYVPNGLAHGFAVLSQEAGIHYKIDAPYHPDKETGIRWNDSDLEIGWPVENPRLSETDKQLPTFAEADEAGLHFSA